MDQILAKICFLLKWTVKTKEEILPYQEYCCVQFCALYVKVERNWGRSKREETKGMSICFKMEKIKKTHGHSL